MSEIREGDQVTLRRWSGVDTASKIRWRPDFRFELGTVEILEVRADKAAAWTGRYWWPISAMEAVTELPALVAPQGETVMRREGPQTR